MRNVWGKEEYIEDFKGEPKGEIPLQVHRHNRRLILDIK
jgi:hypothetical protein